MVSAMTDKYLQRLEETREWFAVNGIVISDWATQRGLEPTVVFSLLAGRTRGRRGKAHVAAVALGLKEAPSANVLSAPGLAVSESVATSE